LGGQEKGGDANWERDGAIMEKPFKPQKVVGGKTTGRKKWLRGTFTEF